MLVDLRACVADFRQGPREPLPQVAFAGRSNVGKSSLLNAVFGQKLAKVSKTPGKTKTLNYFLVNGRCFFVDLPGYGFAAVDKSQRQAWGENVTEYILKEERLRLVVALVDPRVPTSPLDQALLQLCYHAAKPVLVVLTKADALPRHALVQERARVQRDLQLSEPPLIFSAKSGEGKRELVQQIARRLQTPLFG
ncbi:MAG: ribosome biogenesis GTP-binding protein YihA/YsxC [Thermoanaerobaculum sp.]|nr:ribosome biogenesis GTP-binding protein YihA/YsxC [Thermoanaerobaculum sp.]